MISVYTVIGEAKPVLYITEVHLYPMGGRGAERHGWGTWPANAFGGQCAIKGQFEKSLEEQLFNICTRSMSILRSQFTERAADEHMKLRSADESEHALLSQASQKGHRLLGNAVERPGAGRFHTL